MYCKNVLYVEGGAKLRVSGRVGKAMDVIGVYRLARSVDGAICDGEI